MKTTLTFVLILACYSGYSQDTLKIKQIDALVKDINTSPLPIRRDTLVQDRPEIGLKITTYLTTIIKDGELRKYENFANTTMIEKAQTRQMTTSSTFYFSHNKLIKVEEYLIEGDKTKTADWYYADDKPLYYTLQSDKASDRATLLLSMSEGMVKQIVK